MALGVVALVHVWVVSAGTFTHWPEDTWGYYDLLADAFLHGQTHLRVEPPPELLALANPYDAVANQKWRLHDAILYRGKYYFYWGPAPALVAMAAKALGAAHVGDNVLVFAFVFGTTLFIALLLLHVHRRWFPQLPGWPVVVGILAAGLATPMPFLLARPAVYEAAISGGQCFLFAAAYFAVTATDRGRLSRGRLLLAGTCAALALASRLSLAPFVAALLALLWWKLFWAVRPRWRQLLVPCALTAGPIIVAVACLSAYNHARFGAFRKSGIDYMLAGARARRGLDKGPFSHGYVRPNVLNLLFAPVRFDNRFPYILPDLGLHWSRKHPRLRYYVTEEVAGIATAAPLLLLAAFAVPWRRPPDAAPLDWWTSAALASGAAVFLALPLLTFFYCTMRYLGDLTPALSVLTAIGIWRVHRRWPAVRSGLSGVVVLFLAYTCFVGVMLAVTGYYDHFPNHNPGLYRRLRREDDGTARIVPRATFPPAPGATGGERGVAELLTTNTAGFR